HAVATPFQAGSDGTAIIRRPRVDDGHLLRAAVIDKLLRLGVGGRTLLLLRGGTHEPTGNATNNETGARITRTRDDCAKNRAGDGANRGARSRRRPGGHDPV